MAYLVIDTYPDGEAARQKAEEYRRAGRTRVEVLEFEGLTVNDCGCVPCEARYVQDGRPLYVVMAQG